MKTVIIGSNGQLGTDLMRAFEGTAATGLTHADIELKDRASVNTALSRIKPDVIINTAAYDDVPRAEEHSAEAFAVNALGVRHLADFCRGVGATLVQISTDYVFDGTKGAPYDEDDRPNPVNAYGRSKADGERFAADLPAHYIVRVSSIFGLTGCRGKGGRNFVETIIGLASVRPSIDVSSNIVSSPTYTMDAAERIRRLVEGRAKPGTYHVVNAGYCSWYEFALEIVRQTGLCARVEPVVETLERAHVKRPPFSALATRRLEPMRPWQAALSAYLKERTAGRRG